MTIRIGVVGTGHWATIVHTVGIGATPGARLAGIWGRDRDKAQALAQARGTTAFARFEDMLAQVDAVSFAVPPDVQETLALQALAAGKHVLLEKPIATSHAAAQAIAAAAKHASLASIVFFTRRFMPEVTAAIEAHAGRPWRRAEIEIRSAALAAGSPYEHSAWRRAANGALWDVGPHILSVLIAMLGPVTRATRLDAEPGDARFRTEHARGAIATAHVTLRAAPTEVRLRYAFADDAGEFVLPEPTTDRAVIHARATAALVSAITSGNHAHPCDVDLGVETVRILETIERG